MKRPAIFVDTVALLALVNRDDALHERARKINRQLAAEQRDLVTSDWVLAEFLGGAARPALRGAACATVRRLQQSRRTTIITATHADWVRGFELYEARPDKEWSFVDCTSILICQDRNIVEAFTRDRHFVQAGLSILLP